MYGDGIRKVGRRSGLWDGAVWIGQPGLGRAVYM